MLVAGVGEGRVAGAEVDGVDAGRAELGDRRPGLLGLGSPPASASSRATSGFPAGTGPDGAFDVDLSSPGGSQSVRRRGSASAALIPGG